MSKKRKKIASLDDYLHHAKRDMFPKMKSSGMSLVITNSDPDPKLCLEIGAAIMFDKPIIAIVLNEQVRIPANLKRVATRIVYGHPSDPAVQQQIQDAMTAILSNDIRAKRPFVM